MMYDDNVHLLSCVQLFVASWTAARQASLSFTISQSLLKIMSIESVMQSSHLILCCPLLLLPPIFPSVRAFSSESALHLRWPEYWSFGFSISPSSDYSRSASFRSDWQCSVVWIHTPHRRPVICRWAFRLFPYLGCCKWRCHEHWGACLFEL